MTAGVRVGLVLGSREAELARPGTPSTVVDEAVAAEAHGFDSVWVGDSLARPRADPIALLGALAVRTRRVALGTAALSAALRPPLHTAPALRTVDELAGGRLVVAVGTGFPGDDTRQECRAAGIDYGTRARTAHAHVAAWRRLWADREPQSGDRWGPPVWLAGSSPRALAACAEQYDGWLAYPPTPARYRAERERLVELADRHRRAVPTPACLVTLAVAADARRARREADDYCRRYYGRGLAVMEQVQAFACGPAGEVAALLASYRDAGARHLLVRVAAVDPGHRRAAVELVAGEVVAPLRP